MRGSVVTPRVKAHLHRGEDDTTSQSFMWLKFEHSRVGKDCVRGRASAQRAVVLQLNPDPPVPRSPR